MSFWNYILVMRILMSFYFFCCEGSFESDRQVLLWTLDNVYFLLYITTALFYLFLLLRASWLLRYAVVNTTLLIFASYFLIQWLSLYIKLTEEQIVKFCWWISKWMVCDQKPTSVYVSTYLSTETTRIAASIPWVCSVLIIVWNKFRVAKIKCSIQMKNIFFNLPIVF